MRTLKTRLLSLALAIVMVISMVPAALATDAVPETAANESGIVTYTNTAQLSAGEVLADMVALKDYLGDNTTLAEAPAEAVFSVTGSTTADGEPVTYYYSKSYDTADPGNSRPASTANGKLYNITYKWLKPETIDVAKNGGSNSTWLATSTSSRGPIIVDLGGHTIVANTGYFLNVYGNVDFTIQNGTLVRNTGINLIMTGNSGGSDAGRRTKLTLKDANVYAVNQSPIWLRDQTNLTLENSLVYVAAAKNYPVQVQTAKNLKGADLTYNVHLKDSKLLSTDADRGGVIVGSYDTTNVPKSCAVTLTMEGNSEVINGTFDGPGVAVSTSYAPLADYSGTLAVAAGSVLTDVSTSTTNTLPNLNGAGSDGSTTCPVLRTTTGAAVAKVGNLPFAGLDAAVLYSKQEARKAAITVTGVVTITETFDPGLKVTVNEGAAITASNGVAIPSVNNVFDPATVADCVARIGTTGYGTVADAMANAAADDTVVLLAAADTVVLGSGVILDPNGNAVASVTDITGAAVTANEDGTYGPVMAGTVKAETADGTKYFMTLAEAVAEATGAIELLVAATYEGTIALAEGASLNLCGFELTADGVTDSYGNAITAVEGVYDTRNAMVEYTSPDGSVKQNMSLAAALTAAEAAEGSTVKLLKDVSVTANDPYTDLLNDTTYFYKATVDTTIDLNGKTLTSDGYGVATEGTVEDVDITILGKGGKIVTKGNKKAALNINNGSATVSDVTLVSDAVDGNPVNLTGAGKTSTFTNVTHLTHRYIGVGDNHTVVIDGCDLSADVKGYLFYCGAGAVVKIQGTENIVTCAEGALQGGSSKGTIDHTGLDQITGTLPGATMKTIVFVPTGTVAFNDANGNYVLNDGEATIAAADFATVENATIVLTADIENVELAANSTLSTVYAAPTTVTTVIDGVTCERVAASGVYGVVEATYQAPESETVYAGTFYAMLAMSQDATTGGGTVTLRKSFEFNGSFFGNNGSYPIDLNVCGITLDLNGYTIENKASAHLIQFLRDDVDADGNYLTGRLTIKNGTLKSNKSVVSVRGGGVATLEDLTIVSETNGQPAIWFGLQGTPNADNNYIKNCNITTTGNSVVINHGGKNSLFVSGTTATATSAYIFGTATNCVVVLQGISNEFHSPYAELCDPTNTGSINVQSSMIVAEPTEEQPLYVVTFEPLDGAAFVDFDENGVYSDGDSMHEVLQDALDEAAGWAIVVLNKDNTEDVELIAGSTLNEGAYTQSGKVYVLDDNGDRAYAIYPDNGVYFATLTPEVLYVLDDVTYVATLDNVLKAVKSGDLSGGVIKLMQDFEFATTTYPFYFDGIASDITVDLNGYTLTGSSHMFKFNENHADATTRLIVTSSNGRGTINVFNTALRIDGGSVTVENIDIVCTNSRDDLAIHPVTLVNKNSVNYMTNCTVTRIDTSEDKELKPGYTIIVSSEGNAYLEIADSTITNDTIEAISVGSKDVVKIAGTNVVFNHPVENFVDGNGAVNFDEGYTYKATALTEGEGEDAVITGYQTTVTELVKGEPVVGFTAPGAEEVKFYLSSTGRTDATNSVYASVEAAMGAATRAWKEVGKGEIDLYADLTIVTKTVASAISAGNFVYQLTADDQELVVDLNGNTITGGAISGGPALFGTGGAYKVDGVLVQPTQTLTVKNGTVNWGSNRSFYLSGSSSQGDDTQKGIAHVTFENVNVNYTGTAAIAQYNNAPGSTLTIIGGVWKQEGTDPVGIRPTNTTDATSLTLTGGFELHAASATPITIGNNATAQPVAYIDDATVYSGASNGYALISNSSASVTDNNWVYGNAQGGISKATTTATETDGIYKTVVAPASTEDIVAEVNGELYFTIADAVNAMSAYDTVNVIKTPAETAVTLKASTFLTAAEGVDLSGLTVTYENGVEVAVVDGVYTPVEVVYTYGDTTVVGTAQQAFGAWYANASKGTITLMTDLTLSDTEWTACPSNARYIEMCTGSELTLNLNGYTVMNTTNVNNTTTGPALIQISGAEGEARTLVINGGANAADTTKTGKILWGGNRGMINAGASSEPNFFGNITLNNLEIENFSRNSSTVNTNGTVAELGSTVTFHNVKHLGYNSLYSTANKASNVKVILSGNTASYHRGNFKNAVVILYGDQTMEIGENVKFYVADSRSGAIAGFLTETIETYNNYATPDYTFEVIEGDTASFTMKATTSNTNQGYTDAIATGTYNNYKAYKAVAVEAPTYSIYVTGDENGTIVAVPTEAKQGEVVTLTVNPGTTDTTAAITVVGKTTGNSYRLTSDYKFVMPGEEVDVVAVFTQTTYTVSLYEVGMENGTIVAVPTEAVAGSTVTLNPVPAEGYMLDTLYVKTAEGETVAVTAANTFVMPMANVVVYATFKEVPALYNIYVNGGENGTVVVNPTTAAAGTVVTINTTAAEGYELQTLTVTAFTSGAAVEVVDNTFVMPEGGANVYASFAAKKYAINVTASENGAITTDASAAEGKTVVVDVKAAEGYELDILTVTTASGAAVEVNGVTFVMPAEAVTVSATFKSSIKYFNVTVNDATNGIVTATATGTVAEGTEVTVNVAANEGYVLKALTVNGTAVEAVDGKYTFTVTADTVIAATFKAEPVARVEAIALALEGEVVLTLRTVIPDEIVAQEGAYVRLVRHAKSDIEKIIPVAELGAKDANGRYAVTMGIPGAHLTCDVDIEIFDGEGNLISIYDYMSKETAKKATHKTADYINNVLASTSTASSVKKLKTLVSALAVYGGYAQNYYGVMTQDLAYNILPKYNIAVPTLSDITANTITQKLIVSEKSNGMTYSTQNATLDSAVYMSTFLKLNAGENIDNFTFTVTYPVNGVATTMEVTPVYNASRKAYQIDILNIAACYWDYMYTVTATNKTTGEAYEVTGSIMAYVGRMLSSSAAAENLKDLGRAMYYYNQAANTYYGK